MALGRLSGGGQCIDDDWGCTWAKLALRLLVAGKGPTGFCFRLSAPDQRLHKAPIITIPVQGYRSRCLYLDDP